MAAIDVRTTCSHGYKLYLLFMSNPTATCIPIYVS